MRPRFFSWLHGCLLLARAILSNCFGQEIVVDQSALFHGGEGGYPVVGVQQGFTPTLPAISFVEFGFYDHVPGNGIGTEMYVNLREGSFTGTILGRTSVVTIPDGARSLTRFEFLQNIPIVPEMLYFLEPVQLSGDSVWTFSTSYSRGSRYYSGGKSAGSLIFREGLQRAQITSVMITNGAVAITWKGVGVLQTAASALGPWIEFPGKTNNVEQIDLQAYGLNTNCIHIFRIRD